MKPDFRFLVAHKDENNAFHLISVGEFFSSLGARHSFAKGKSFGMTIDIHEQICEAAHYLCFEPAARDVDLDCGYRVSRIIE